MLVTLENGIGIVQHSGPCGLREGRRGEGREEGRKEGGEKRREGRRGERRGGKGGGGEKREVEGNREL